MNVRPRLRSDIVFRSLTNREESYVIVKDPRSRKYYQFEDWEYDLLRLLDGTRDTAEIAEALKPRSPERADPQYLADYLEELRRLDLLERSDRERHLVMMDRLKEQRKDRLLQGSGIFQVHFPLFDPDELMNRVIGWIRWWWSPWFVGVALVVFAVVLGFLVKHWELYWSGFLSLWNFPEKDLGAWIGFFALLFGVSVWHELGHGLTCKRYGGEVHDIGIMLFYLQPVFYCGIDDSYLFARRSQRIWAALGGPYFELLLCSAAAAVWLLTPAEWTLHTVALTIVFFTGLSAIVFNLNPLIKFDAYYVLMDWLDVPNLREESFGYIGNLLKERIFHLPVHRRAISARRRRIYLYYGILSLIYTGLVLTVLYVILRDWLVGWMGPVGYLVALGVVGYIFRRPARGLVRFVRHFVLDKREWIRSGRRPAMIAAGLALGVALLTLVRCDTRINGEFVVVPGERAVVRVPAGGFVRSVGVSEGDQVSEGQILATLYDPDLDTARRIAESDLDSARRRSAAARRDGETALAREWTEEARGAEARLAQTRRRLDELVLVSPMAGVVATPDLGDRVGSYLREGETFCVIASLETVKLVVPVSELDIEEIREGMPVRLLATALPWTPVEASVLSVAPVAVRPEPSEDTRPDVVRRANVLRVEVEVPNLDARLRPGMTGRVQLRATPRSVAGKIWWRLRRWAASIVW